MSGPDVAFWQERFDTQQTAWDRGAASPQLIAWLDSGVLQPCRIAVPGCGSGWEVAELARRGFDVLAIDYTQAAIERTQALLQQQGLRAELLQADVLELQLETPLDAVYEQTCLCAIHPDHWAVYARQLRQWLRPGGEMHVLFMQLLRPNASQEGMIQGPPYHCDVNAMRSLFTAQEWNWPKPPYAKVAHPSQAHELGLRLVRR